MSASFILPRTHKDGREIASRQKVMLEASVFIGKLSPDKPWELLIRPWKKSRTDAQNHALFGVAYKIMAEETGFTAKELHYALCCEFFGEKEVLGKFVPFRTTTTDQFGKRDVLDWSVFSNFYATVERIASEAGIVIPSPDPAWRTRK